MLLRCCDFVLQYNDLLVSFQGIEEELPSLAHFDGTARPQTVSSNRGDAGYEPWLYKLLSEVKVLTGYGVLINTSFNSRGKPILNKISDALILLRECPDLDYVLINGWLFEKHETNRRLIDLRTLFPDA